VWIRGTIHTLNLAWCENPHSNTHTHNPRIEFKINYQFFKTYGESVVLRDCRHDYGYDANTIDNLTVIAYADLAKNIGDNLNKFISRKVSAFAIVKVTSKITD